MITTLILDRGHATLDSKGKYSTPGKQYTFPDGLHVYEGFENQKYTEAIAEYAKTVGFKIEYTVEPKDPTDLPLYNRVVKANASKARLNALYISIHNNAGAGIGTEVFTSIGKTLSDTFAEGILNSYQKGIPTRKLRMDTKDGDKDKEENFYVISKTSMPAILIEFGFFDNREDYNWLSNPNTIKMMAKLTVDGIVNTNIQLYGKEAWETRNF
jgi:N-acetylmuramoyl-L-alanine amidase